MKMPFLSAIPFLKFKKYYKNINNLRCKTIIWNLKIKYLNIDCNQSQKCVCTCSIQFAIFLFLIEKSDTICHISNTVSLFYLLLFIMKPYVLDLDHCLIYASYSEIPDLELISQRGYHFLYHRPHTKEFLNFLIKSKYDLIFYTSSKKEYAHWVVQSFGLNKKFPIYSRFLHA